VRPSTMIGAATIAGALAISTACSAAESPRVPSVDEAALREYGGAYQWGPDAFVYLQLWNELTGTDQLVAFDETGELRTLYPIGRDRFFTGPAAAVATPVESRIEFQRDRSGRITSLTWRREGRPARTARRVEIEREEEVRFSNGGVQLSGTLITPATGGRHPAIILVHGSGPANREWTLPFARFLIRRGMAVLTFDKRGVGRSTGDWNSASFDDLAGDVVAGFEYLKTHREIDAAQVGLLGVSQAGWIMPLAAVRARDLAFLISISGPGVPAAETTIDNVRGEMAAAGTPGPIATRIVHLMELQYRFARTGEGWDEYASARSRLGLLMPGGPPETFPGTADHPYWQVIRRSYFYDPAPTLRQVELPVLALFGELDHNILPEKNRAAWEAALDAGGNRDHTLRILPRATHLQLEAEAGSAGGIASSRRFVPAYFTIVHDWLAERVRGFGGSTSAP
jgi:uncharacterized protein